MVLHFINRPLFFPATARSTERCEVYSKLSTMHAGVNFAQYSQNLLYKKFYFLYFLKNTFSYYLPTSLIFLQSLTFLQSQKTHLAIIIINGSPPFTPQVTWRWWSLGHRAQKEIKFGILHNCLQSSSKKLFPAVAFAIDILIPKWWPDQVNGEEKKSPKRCFWWAIWRIFQRIDCSRYLPKEIMGEDHLVKRLMTMNLWLRTQMSMLKTMNMIRIQQKERTRHKTKKRMIQMWYLNSLLRNNFEMNSSNSSHRNKNNTRKNKWI